MIVHLSKLQLHIVMIGLLPCVSDLNRATLYLRLPDGKSVMLCFELTCVTLYLKLQYYGSRVIIGVDERESRRSSRCWRGEIMLSSRMYKTIQQKQQMYRQQWDRPWKVRVNPLRRKHTTIVSVTLQRFDWLFFTSMFPLGCVCGVQPSSRHIRVFVLTSLSYGFGKD